MTLKQTLLAFTLGIAALTGPASAGGPVIEDAAETPADVARSFAHRWPEVLIGGAVGAVVLLAISGWL